MARCSVCGEEIKFVRIKKDSVSIPVDPAIVYFLPPNGYDRAETFINVSGCEVRGIRAQDGMIGYKRHVC